MPETAARDLAGKLIAFLETGAPPDGLFAPDVFCDFTPRAATIPTPPAPSRGYWMASRRSAPALRQGYRGVTFVARLSPR